MKVGVISDIHSNYIAFKEVIGYMEKEGCDEYLFLGDYVSDTPYTRETMELFYEFLETHTCTCLRGNREEYMLSQRKVVESGDEANRWLYNSASGNLLYTYERLTQDDLDFFESLPITFEYKREGYPAIRCCHGSPVNSRELIQLGSDRARYWLENISCDYLLCAHTHFPGEYTYNGKHYFNSGCVGISIGDFGYAQCLILHGEPGSSNGHSETLWRPEFLKIPYDNKRVVRDIKISGLLDKAHWFINSNIQILLTGVDNSAALVKLAGELSKEAGEKGVWPNIDEKYFALAAEKLGVPDYAD